MLASIDTRSVILTLSAVRLALIAGLALYARVYRTYDGFRSWVAGIAAGVLVVGALLLRTFSVGASVVSNNLLVPLSGILFLDASTRFASGRPADRRWYLLIPLNGLVNSFFYFAWDRQDVRIWVTAAVVLAVSVTAALEWLQPCPPSRRRLYRATAVVSACYGGLFLVRGVAWGLRDTAPDMFAQGTPDGWFFLGLGILDSCLATMVLMLNGQRLEEDLLAANGQLRLAMEELRESTAQVKILTGILPMCSHCKRIRDAEERWVPVDQYVTQKSEARISHGLCPPCLEELYPEYVDLV